MKIKLAISLILILLFASKASSLEFSNQTYNSPNLNNIIIPTEPLTNYSTLWGLKRGSSTGQGTIFYSPQPIQITGEKWITATAGVNNSLGIKSDGTLWAWGSNPYGEYGNGIVKDSSLFPIKIGEENNWKFVTAGLYCTFGIKTDGSLWAWGSNEYGVLGDSTKQDRPQPVRIGKNCLGKVRFISAGTHTIAAITEDGSLWIWGWNTDGRLGDGTNIDKYYPVKIGNIGEWKTVSCNTNATFGIKTDGTLWAWGNNSHGYLGDGTTISQNKPIQIGTDNDWTEISSNYATLALKTDGTLWAWGWNYYACIGDGTLNDVFIPTRIGKDNDWVSVKSFHMRSIGLKKDGTLWRWGQGDWNKEKLSSDTLYIPTKMENISNVTQILSSSGYHTLILRNYKATPGKIETISVTNVTPNSAECGGNVTSAGSEIIYQRGVCYGITANPTIDNAITEDGTSLGEFQSNLTNLQSFRKYYYRAYLRTAAGDAYGEEKIFLTGLITPILIHPPKNEIVDPIKVTFEWNLDIHDLGYRFQLSESSDFSSFVVDTTIEFPKFIYEGLKLNCEYFWHVQTTNGEYLSDWSEVWSFRTGSTSVSDGSNSIQIIPNPAGDFITVTLAGDINPMLKHGVDMPSDIVIYNTLGEKVTTVGAIHELPLQINISALPKGMYFVRIGGKIAKFVKM